MMHIPLLVEFCHWILKDDSARLSHTEWGRDQGSCCLGLALLEKVGRLDGISHFAIGVKVKINGSRIEDEISNARIKWNPNEELR